MPSTLEKALAEAARIASQYGIELDTETIAHHDEIQQQKEVAKQANSNALEVVLNQLHHKHATMVKKCLYCKGKFFTTYCYHQFCSDQCRTAEFIEHFKIDPAKLKPPASFWEYEQVGVVPAELSHKLYGWAKHLVDQYESLTDQQLSEVPEGPEEPEYDPEISEVQSPGTQQPSNQEEDSSLQANLQNTLDSLDSLAFDFESF